MKLANTTALMHSVDYKDRFIAEYWQTKIRYEKLKSFCNRIEAWEILDYETRLKTEPPKHDCPYPMLRDQQRIMGEYLHVLEIRAIIENIDLNEGVK